ncbi:MAG: hypothetical protein IK099_03650 [Clostridia bacterium]|nr:hypothetical protein [Clostridia bacterium]
MDVPLHELTGAHKYDMIYTGNGGQFCFHLPMKMTGLKKFMEEKTTKRFIILFAVLVLCLCPQALAEETNPQPAEQQQPDGASLPDALLEIEPIIADEEQAEPAGQEASAAAPEQAPGGEEQEKPENEPAPPQDAGPLPHDDTHHVEERPRNTVYQETDSMETHAAVVTYDLYCVVCRRVVAENCRSEQCNEPHAWSAERREPTCSKEGSIHTVCTLCNKAYDETLPCLEHAWSEWEDVSDASLPVCERPQIKVRHCLACGREEMNTISAPGHQWEAVSYTEATCTEDGSAVRRCVYCGQEDVIVLPAYGHTYVQMTGQDGSTQDVCALCGDVKEESKSASSHMYYNNTVTSFGPTTRELIGGSVWNRVTPVDLSQEGVFTYPLVASNMYTVGTATLVNQEDIQEFNYKLSSSNINVHSESLVVYPDLESLKTGENAVSFDFNSPIDLKACFGEDARVIVAITLRADYDPDSMGVRYFYADQNMIDQMMRMIQ